MFTFPVQRHIVDSIVILGVDPSYDSNILSHVELISLHVGSVLGIYFFSWLIWGVGDSPIIYFYTQDRDDRLVWDPSVNGMYALHFMDYVVMLHSQRCMIRVTQPIVAAEIERLTWDPGIILIVGLHSQFLVPQHGRS